MMDEVDKLNHTQLAKLINVYAKNEQTSLYLLQHMVKRYKKDQKMEEKIFMHVCTDLMKYPMARKIIFENLFDLNNPVNMSFISLRNILIRMM